MTSLDLQFIRDWQRSLYEATFTCNGGNRDYVTRDYAFRSDVLKRVLERLAQADVERKELEQIRREITVRSGKNQRL